MRSFFFISVGYWNGTTGAGATIGALATGTLEILAPGIAMIGCWLAGIVTLLLYEDAPVLAVADPPTYGVTGTVGTVGTDGLAALAIVPKPDGGGPIGIAIMGC